LSNLSKFSLRFHPKKKLASEVKGKVIKIEKNEYGKMILIKCLTINEKVSYQIGLQDVICVQFGMKLILMTV